MAFAKKNKKERIDSTPTLIGAKSVFEGNYKGEDNICIEGIFKGIIECSEDVYINHSALIEGDISGKNVVVHGKVVGNVIAKETLIIGEKGKIVGDISTKVFSVDRGGILHGNCNMQEKIKDIKKDSRTRNLFEKFSILTGKKSNEIKEKINDFEKSISISDNKLNPLDMSINNDDDLIEVKESSTESSN